MIKKSFYEAPEAELLLVKFEESFLTETNLNGLPTSTVTTVEDSWDDTEG